MQRVPGLRPTPQNQLRPVRVGSRVQAPDAQSLRPKTLQPVATPVDTYVQPQQPGEDPGLSSLAEALRGLNPEIGRYLERRSQGSMADAMEYLQTHDISEVNELVRTGQTPAVLQTMEGRRVYAERRAREDFAEIQRRYNEDFARGEGDIQGLINEVVGETFSIYGEDDTFKSVYTQVFDPLHASILETHQADATSLEIDRRRDDVFMAWHERIANGVQLGEDPSLLVQSIFNDFPNNHDFLRIHPQEQQEMLLQLASQQVSAGHFDMAEALLQMERKDGPYRGSLLSNRQTSEQAANLWEQIQSERIRVGNAAAETAAYESVIEEALQAGEEGRVLSMGSRTINSADGTTRTVSQEEINRVTADRAYQRIAETAAYNGWTEDQIEQEEIRYYTTSGLEHPVWVNMWRNATNTASLQNISQGNLTPDLAEGFEQYRQMSAEHGHYLAGVLDEKTRGFYDTANLLLEARLVPDEASALQQAAIATMSMSPSSSEAQANWQKVNDAATSVVNRSDHWTGAGWQVTNLNEVKTEVNRYTTLFMLAGLGEDAAIEAAKEAYENTHTNVMQAYVLTDPRMPAERFKPLVEDYARWFLEQNPDLDWEFDLGDLSIRQVGNGPGSYQLVDARTRIGLTEFDGYEFSLRSLLDWEEARKQEEIDRIAAASGTVPTNAGGMTAQNAEDLAIEAELRAAGERTGAVIGVVPTEPGDPIIDQMR